MSVMLDGGVLVLANVPLVLGNGMALDGHQHCLIVHTAASLQ
jgi:hypothetical protein